MPHKTAKFWNKRRISIIDRMMYVVSIIHPLTAIPQVVEIFASQNASGVSLWTWLGFMAIGLVFLTYGIAHNLKPFIVNQIIWFVIDLLVVVGIFLYG